MSTHAVALDMASPSSEKKETEPRKPTRAENAENAIKIVDQIIEDGMVAQPADYVVDDVKFNPIQAYDEYGRPVSGEIFLDKESVINRGSIEIYPSGAITLDEAILTYAHEIGYFNDTWSEYRAEAFAKEVLAAYKLKMKNRD